MSLLVMVAVDLKRKPGLGSDSPGGVPGSSYAEVCLAPGVPSSESPLLAPPLWALAKTGTRAANQGSRVQIGWPG